MLNQEAGHSAAEFVKLLLALTGLPWAYRKIDRWRRRHRKPQFDFQRVKGVDREQAT